MGITLGYKNFASVNKIPIGLLSGDLTDCWLCNGFTPYDGCEVCDGTGKEVITSDGYRAATPEEVMV